MRCKDSPQTTAAKYDEVIKQLEIIGAGAPERRSYHVSYSNPESIQVTDVWDNMEDFQAFGETLVPIMKSVGADPGQPETQEVNNIISGEHFHLSFLLAFALLSYGYWYAVQNSLAAYLLRLKL